MVLLKDVLAVDVESVSMVSANALKVTLEPPVLNNAQATNNKFWFECYFTKYIYL